MKAASLSVELASISRLPIARAIIPILERAEPLVRPRKRLPRTDLGKRVAPLGYASPADSWRPLLRRYLRRRLPPNCWVYVGGHHIAVMLRHGAFCRSSMTVARFVEVSPKRAKETKPTAG